MTNQELYDQEYSKLNKTNTGQNGYGLLVYSLEAVLKQAGHDITGKELAGQYHNQVVGMIEQDDFNKICQGFIANFTMGTSIWPPYALKRVADGNLGYNYELSQTPTIGAFTILEWQKEASASLKAGTNGKRIMCRGKRYQAWIADKAMKACPKMLEVAADAVVSHSQKIADFIEEAGKEDALALETIAHYERTLYVIKAFMDVSEAEDEWGIVSGFEEKIKILKDGLMARNVSRVFLEQKEYTPEQIIEASLQKGALKDLLDYYLERNDDNVKE